MGNEKWERIETIIDEILQLPQNDWLGFLEKKSDLSQEVKSEVTSLLQSITDSEGWLENANTYKKNLLGSFSDKSSASSLLGSELGSYQVTGIIAQGGMGTVYRGERTDGEFEHTVAIKVIKRGMNTTENIRLFHRERNILAGLNHPGIAKLFDGGVLENGSPYLVMEYIEGTPIDQYCDENNLSIDKRIELFKKVLKAVRHAHENLTIHRDLKPDNILITNEGQVKVLDFGIAKLLDTKNNSVNTTQTRILTPKYAAPEQIRQQPVTTATDLYSLGVILYQLLVGRNPYDLEGKSIHETENRILNSDPIQPDKRLIRDTKSQILSAKRSSTPGMIAKKMKGDLNAILLKAIEKDPDIRYRTSDSLLDEFEKYSSGLPISARQRTTRYRLNKFIRRNKTSLSGISMFFILLVGFTFFHTQQITQERNQAQFEADKAEVVTEFLISLFEENDPNISKGDTLTARHLLAIGEKKINQLNGKPAIKSEILQVLGNIYDLLSYPEKADSLKNISLALKQDIYHSSDPELASIYSSLAITKKTLGEYETALNLLDTTISYKKDIYGSQSKEVGQSLSLVAKNLKEKGEVDSAYKMIDKSKSIYSTLEDTLDSDFLQVLMEMGLITKAKGNLKESETIWRRSLRLSHKLFTPPHPKIMDNINGLASVLKELEKFAEAESLYKGSVKMTKKLYGKKHIKTAVTLNDFAGLYYYIEEYQKADKRYKEAYAILKDILGQEHPYVSSNLYNQANLKADMGEFEDAKILYHQVLELDKDQFGEIHPNVASNLTGLGSLYKKEKMYNQAIEYYNRSLTILKQIYENQNHHSIIYNKKSLAEIMVATKEYTKAEHLYDTILSSAIETFGKNHEQTKNIADNYAELLGMEKGKVSVDSLMIILNN